MAARRGTGDPSFMRYLGFTRAVVAPVRRVGAARWTAYRSGSTVATGFTAVLSKGGGWRWRRARGAGCAAVSELGRSSPSTAIGRAPSGRSRTHRGAARMTAAQAADRVRRNPVPAPDVMRSEDRKCPPSGAAATRTMGGSCQRLPSATGLLPDPGHVPCRPKRKIRVGDLPDHATVGKAAARDRMRETIGFNCVSGVRDPMMQR